MPKNITQQCAKQQTPIVCHCQPLDAVGKTYPTCLKVIEASGKLLEASSYLTVESL